MWEMFNLRAMNSSDLFVLQDASRSEARSGSNNVICIDLIKLLTCLNIMMRGFNGVIDSLISLSGMRTKICVLT